MWIGRIVFAKDGQLVIEIVAEGRTLDWHLANEAIVISKNGTRTALAVDASRTTREGNYDNGAIVRLALRIPEDFDATQIDFVLFAGVQVEMRA